jgi:hypothetical protein
MGNDEKKDYCIHFVYLRIFSQSSNVSCSRKFAQSSERCCSKAEYINKPARLRALMLDPSCDITNVQFLDVSQLFPW